MLKKAIFTVGLLTLALLGVELSSGLLLSSQGILEKIRYEKCEHCSEISKRLWLKAHREDGSPYYAFDEYDSLLGWRLKPGLRDLEVFQGKRLSSNSQGLRGKEEFAREKVRGKLRVALLGDSFTFGEELSDQESFAAKLGLLLPHAEIMNFGTHGYGYDQMLLLLENKVLKFKPDLIIVAHMDLDSIRHKTWFRDYAKPYFELDSKGELELKGVPVPRPEELLSSYPLASLDLLKTSYKVFCSEFYLRDQKEIETKIFERMKKGAEGIQSELILMHLPVVIHKNSPPEALEEIDSSEKRDNSEEGFYEFCEKLKLRCFHLRPQIVRGLRAYPHYEDPSVLSHWPPAFQELIAKGIFEYLKTQGPVLQKSP